MADDEPTEVDMQDADAVEEEHMMYGHGGMTEEELNEKYPNRPHNHSKTIPFHDLYLTLFNPLKENTKKPTGPAISRKKIGPHGPRNTPHEIRRSIIERFISRWRNEVGNDVYPAFRLIVPEKDRDRAMYGLKEATLAKLLVNVMKIDKNSEDAQNLLHWKLPGVKASSAMAGDFAGRCYEVISKRPMRTTPGEMTIAEVNELLDRLSVAQKEENQRPIMEHFYTKMNAEELQWLIRMILRQMKVGATEKTIFEVWHPDADNLFNISSSLRRVCWELYDPQFRLEGDNKGINLMQCFQPQLAAFQMRSMEQMVSRMNATEEDPVFFVEEKLDGERMQLHMMEDDETPGGMRFGFWSRKAKDYTYLYGNGFEDDNGALTRHLKVAFAQGVRNIILDGEMITWNPTEDAVVGFGTLKTAALSEQQNPFANGNRPLFRVFDCLYLNDKDLTKYTLRIRRQALKESIKDVHRRLEVHDYKERQQASDIEPLLREVIATRGEGLVLKNPRSMYHLNARNDDWIKVKPEYMTEFGESLDCIVVGGYYGSGKRGGGLSSFLCGLAPPADFRKADDHPQKVWSFFKVGGGFKADDYAQVRHLTEGKWHDWNFKKPPYEVVELAGGDRQYEKPDVWIYPEDSIVVEVKAASIGSTDQFRTRNTLRFPRFKRLRNDKDWKSALDFEEFKRLQSEIEEQQKDKQFKIDDERRKRTTRKRKRSLIIAGQDEEVKTPYAGPTTKVFEGLNFFIMTEAQKPIKKSKVELEQIVTANGGNIVASEKVESTILIADRNLVKVASLTKKNQRNLIRSSWLIECVKQSDLDPGRPRFLLPFEPQHLFHIRGEDAGTGMFNINVDEHGDSYAKDVTTGELMGLLKQMPADFGGDTNDLEVIDQLNERGGFLDDMPGYMFHGVKAYCDDVPTDVVRLLLFATAGITDSLEDPGITHVVVSAASDRTGDIFKTFSSWPEIPRIVTPDWVSDSWKERTRLDEERYALQ